MAESSAPDRGADNPGGADLRRAAPREPGKRAVTPRHAASLIVWRQASGEPEILMGVRHGLFCLGCCWALMALLFVAGVMNLLWVAAIAVAVLIEKVVPRGDLVGRVAGVALVIAGLLVAGSAVVG